MRRVLALLALAGLAGLARPSLAEKRLPAEMARAVGAAGSERDADADEDSDSAPFMIVVEHSDGRRCGGSLVSLRTALTSAWCARGPGGAGPRQLRALAPAAPPARPASRRVARVVLAGAPATPGDDAELDIAVLELEAPFGGAAHSRPILMATRPEDCETSAMCHVVRAVGAAPRLRIVDAAPAPGARCGLHARGPGLREPALCLAGPALCARDRGAGVVCGGKLCGVLSRSARTSNRSLEAAEAADVQDDTCGDTHVAQSVARWRRFLHCAHTLRACERGGECAQLCTEHQLLAAAAEGEEAAQEVDAPAEPSPRAQHDQPAPRLPLFSYGTERSTSTIIYNSASPTVAAQRQRTHTSVRTRPSPTHTTVVSLTPAPLPRTSFEFEPNRADFKAGEYGDNVAEYGGDESAGGGGAPPSADPSPATTLPPPRALETPSPPTTHKLNILRTRKSHHSNLAPRAAAAPVAVSFLFLCQLYYMSCE